jgi:hypothetical protein
MGKIRADEARQFPEILKKSQYLFLKNPENLTPEEEQRLDAIVTSQSLKSTEAYTQAEPSKRLLCREPPGG